MLARALNSEHQGFRLARLSAEAASAFSRFRGAVGRLKIEPTTPEPRPKRVIADVASLDCGWHILIILGVGCWFLQARYDETFAYICPVSRSHGSLTRQSSQGQGPGQVRKPKTNSPPDPSFITATRVYASSSRTAA